MKKLGMMAVALMLVAGCALPTSSVVDQQRAIETYVQLGLNYLGSGQRDQARFNLLKALELDRNAPEALHGMALLYQSEGEVALAEQNFQRALSQDRDFTQARMNFARFLFLEGRFDRARAEYLRVTQDANYRLRPDAFVGLGLSELELGNREGARLALNRALSLNPNQATALIEAAELAWDEQDYAQARNYLDRFERVARQTPASLWLGVRLAWTAQDRDRAASYGLALTQIYPDSNEALLYRQSGDP